MKIVSNLEVDGNFNIGLTSATISSAGNALFQTVSGTHFGNLSGTASNSVQLLNSQNFGMIGDVSAANISFNGTSSVTFNSVLSATGVVSGIYGNTTNVSQFQVDSKGRIISASNVAIQFPVASGGSVSSVGVSSTTLTIGSSPVTTSGNISVNLSLFGTSGTFPKISTDPFGRVISGTTLTSADIPPLPYLPTSSSITFNNLSAQPALTFVGNATNASAKPTSLNQIQSLEMLEVMQRNCSVWTAWGHSYFNQAAATYDQTGRFDSLVRDLMRIPVNNWYNRAINGTQFSCDGLTNQGGWSSIAFNTQYRGNAIGTKKAAPYTPVGGGDIICVGLNDLGHFGPASQSLQAWIHAMRFSISRFRASTVLDNTDTSITYGTGFVSSTNQFGKSTMGILRTAVSATSASTFTITIPSDYNGEPIAVMLLGKPGLTGGVVTWSGTAGWTGTTSTSNIKSSADNTTCSVCKRGVAPITSATQTIIGTVTSIDTSGSVSFDSWWLESISCDPVIVCNISRLPIVYSAYTAWNTVSPTLSAQWADVASWNSSLSSLVAEFDGMVQIADTYNAVAPISANFSTAAPSYLHYNEVGAAYATSAVLIAVNSLSVPTSGIQTQAMASAPVSNGGIRKIIRPVNYYLPPFSKISSSLYTCVSGDMFALPWQVTDGAVRFDQCGIEMTNSATTGTTFRVGLFSDTGWNNGYPGQLCFELASGIAAGTTAGLKTASISNMELDPGLWWLVFQVNTTVSAYPTLRMVDGPVPGMPDLGTNGLPISGQLGPVAWKLTGQPNQSFSPIFPQTGATLVPSAPALTLRSDIPG